MQVPALHRSRLPTRWWRLRRCRRRWNPSSRRRPRRPRRVRATGVVLGAQLADRLATTDVLAEERAVDDLDARIRAALGGAVAVLADRVAAARRRAEQDSAAGVLAQVAAAVRVGGADLALDVAATERLAAPFLARHRRVLTNAAAALAAAAGAVLAGLQAAAALCADATIAEVGAALDVVGAHVADLTAAGRRIAAPCGRAVERAAVDGRVALAARVLAGRAAEERCLPNGLRALTKATPVGAAWCE